MSSRFLPAWTRRSTSAEAPELTSTRARCGWRASRTTTKVTPPARRSKWCWSCWVQVTGTSPWWDALAASASPAILVRKTQPVVNAKPLVLFPPPGFLRNGQHDATSVPQTHRAALWSLCPPPREWVHVWLRSVVREPNEVKYLKLKCFHTHFCVSQTSWSRSTSNTDHWTCSWGASRTRWPRPGSSRWPSSWPQLSATW